jgi:Domain of unknown function (DUF1788)
MDSSGTEPIFYLVFPTVEILEVKRQTKAWIAKLRNDGWTVVALSMAEAIHTVLGANKLRKLWLQTEREILARAESEKCSVDFLEINKTLAASLLEGDDLQAMIQQKLEEAESHKSGLLLFTDLEALHPYLRINTIEAKLQNRTHCPVVILYPGRREGKTSLRFLEFYPPDPNYRSEHIG